MANQITDNRTLVNSLDAATPPTTDLSGTGAGTRDTEIFIQGTSSVGQYVTNTLSGLLYDAGSAQDWSNNVFYIWINCGIVGLLASKASGGFRIRFAAATTPASNYKEFYLGGNDSWPNAISGGWVQFVVDIEATASNSAGTLNTNAVRYVGFAAQTGGTMPRMADNTWMDEIRRLPDGSPGIIVEGRNGGTTPWTSANIATQLGVATGTFVQSTGGSYKINTPIQFGINDTTVHGFSDTNVLWLWDNQEFAPSDLYKISALGNAGGTTNVTLGVKSGTGADATGAQGAIIQAASSGVRWAMDFDDPNLDSIGLYGCSFIHGADFQLDSAAVEAISSNYIDCSSATISNSLQQRNSVINANTADGVAFMTTDDLGDIKYCNFEFSDGHAIELTTPRVASQTSLGNSFSGYGAIGTNDAAVYNNTAGAVTINVTSGDSPTYRNGTSASTTVVASSTYYISNVIAGTEVRIIVGSSSPVELAGVESIGVSPEGLSNCTTEADPDNAGRYRVVYTYNQADAPIAATIRAVANEYVVVEQNVTIPVAGGSLLISQRLDRNYNNPP